MIPVRFGEPGRRLLGLVHPPDRPAPSDRGVLVCSPFGQEAIRSHRLQRILAERLARDGFPVMRFDYLGTGDSDGDDEDGDLPTWTEDVLRASVELAAGSATRRSAWVGLRLGATLAALASGRAAPAPERLVLWDPVVDGRRYLQELAEAHAAEMKPLHADPRGQGRAPPVGPDGSTEALGFVIPPRLQAQLRALTLDSFAALRAGRVEIVDGGTSADAGALAERFASRGLRVTTRRISTRIVWASDEAMNTAVAPADALQALLAAVTEGP
jgi:pimeloyl-ACP methyl ester carboxylesterase